MQTVTLYILPFLRAVSVMVFVGWILSRFLEHLPWQLQKTENALKKVLIRLSCQNRLRLILTEVE
jgi:hypothetical protein